MNRRTFLQVSAIAATAKSSRAADSPIPVSVKEQIDFGYAFAPPHRMAVARPEASEKTLLDLEPGALTVSWSYDDLRNTPLAILKPPRTQWRVKIRPLWDGQPFAESTWTRGECFLPILSNQYAQAAGAVQLEALGGISAALIRITAQNRDSQAHQLAISCEVLDGWVAHNPAWMGPGGHSQALLACQGDRPDRVLLFGIGADRYPVGRMTMTSEWTLQPGETRHGWIVRPYAAYEEDLEGLSKKDWNTEFDAAVKEWRELLERAVQVEIPDEGVRNGLYASLGDLFIMREPLAKGYVGTLCGTEGYRSTNPFEPSLTAIALDQLGFHAEAANGLRVHLEMQEPDGNWSDPKGWAHHIWGCSGMKAWAAMEHFRLTGDRAYLESVFPRLAASSRWQEKQRRKTRVPEDSGADPISGLMPRGMGDAGLMNGTDYFGVFYPHNFLATFADGLSVEAAETLGKDIELPELRRIHQSAVRDLRASLEIGAIRDSDLPWIPDSPNNPTGSRWGALYAFFPIGLLEGQDPLIRGTLKKIEGFVSPGGQPLHTGWMTDGAWVGITLDNVAETHLALGNGDTAIAYLYSSLNHGTPLYTWCEERGAEPGTKKTSGDRQHLWTPLAVVRFLRDALVMEQGDSLHLGLGTARSWMDQGKKVGIRDAPTHFGTVSYRMESAIDRGVILAEIHPPNRKTPREMILHVRHPQRATMRKVVLNGRSGSSFDAKWELIRIPPEAHSVRVEVHY